MSTSTGTGWAQLRQQARSLETQTETLFHTYSQFSAITNIPPKPSEDERSTEMKATGNSREEGNPNIATLPPPR
ncbi:hypothetical protein EYC84_010096 [Monilinia fructicola]|uniref:Uncharacterized protein n=1 Tax=Monilinia fructicola TaxID=38448 RepID=A0A5M9JGB5_MONFR|nr:hypothetical protein EYC84_010096 [Monilinia fructicola]